VASFRTKTLYIKNIVKREVALHDVGIRLKPGQYYDLLSSPQPDAVINRSIREGSIAKNRGLNTIMIVQNLPQKIKMPVQISEIPLVSRGIIPISEKNEQYEELNKDVDIQFDEYPTEKKNGP
jgi:hypothetical protein